MNKSVFAWSYIYPSKGSCKNNCQVKKIIDCSCESSCYFKGDCCQDIEEFCVNFSILRKSNKIDNQKN